MIHVEFVEEMVLLVSVVRMTQLVTMTLMHLQMMVLVTSVDVKQMEKKSQ